MINMRERVNTGTDSLPYVTAIICHYVGMFAALYYDDLLLDDRKIILCGTRQREKMHVNYPQGITYSMNTGVAGGITCTTYHVDRNQSPIAYSCPVKHNVCVFVCVCLLRFQSRKREMPLKCETSQSRILQIRQQTDPYPLHLHYKASSCLKSLTQLWAFPVLTNRQTLTCPPT